MRDITLEDTFTFDFTTRQFSDGVPTVLAGTPVLSAKEGANATPITAGVSVAVDTASVVGLNEGTVVATAANGFESGKSYAIYISTGTVGGVSVIGEVVQEFTIELSAAAVDLANATDGLGALKTLIDAVQTAVDALNDISAADVNAEVVDALTVDAISELTQAAPSATPSISDAIMGLYMDWRNETITNSSDKKIKNDAGTVIINIPVAEAGGTFTKSKAATGP